MTTFKIKSSKTDTQATQITLHLKHTNKINDFVSQQSDELNSLKQQLEIKQKRFDELSIIISLTIEQLIEKNNLKDSIENLHEKINNISNHDDELDYFSSTMDIFTDYYNLDNNPNFTKVSLSNTYEKLINKNNIINKNTKLKILTCSICKTEKYMATNESYYVCPTCGETDNVQFETEKVGNSEHSKEGSAYYKRINHFIEWLNQIQGKEATIIPDEIHNMIMAEIKKLRIIDLSIITPLQIRQILKKLHLNKYYEHIFYIINKINGLPPPTFSRETEEKFKQMFRAIQIPFTLYNETTGINKRKNFLSYSYILHKFSELLGLDEYLPCFPLLKNKEKLRQQDKIFKKICNHLNWQFYPST